MNACGRLVKCWMCPVMNGKESAKRDIKFRLMTCPAVAAQNCDSRSIEASSEWNV